MQVAAATLAAVADRLLADRCSAADRWVAAYAVTAIAGSEAKVARRDAALRNAATVIAGDLPVADQVRLLGAEVKRYASRWRSTDEHMVAPPETYAGTARLWLFEAFAFGDGEVPDSRRSLGRILASH